jgi:hypothetical protein
MVKHGMHLLEAFGAILVLEWLGLGPSLLWIILGVALLEWHRKKMDKLEGKIRE